MKPLAIDLYCGLGGWTEGLLAEGYDVVGFDNERHVYGDQRYPAQLVLQDVLTLHGSQFRDAALIVASPPCQAYSYRAMPWKRAKALPPPSNELFDACFRLQREAIDATGQDCPACGGKGFMIWYVGEIHPCERCDGKGHITRHIPLVVENVRGAQPWVGRAAWHYGSFYLWGDVPVLMPSTRVLKVAGFNFHQQEKTGQPGGSFQSAAVGTIKNNGGSRFAQAHNTGSGHSRNPVTDLLNMHPDESQKGLGGGWFDKPYKERGDITGRFNSKSSARKAASAQIAKIPFELASWIARCYKPLA